MNKGHFFKRKKPFDALQMLSNSLLDIFREQHKYKEYMKTSIEQEILYGTIFLDPKKCALEIIEEYEKKETK